MNVRERVFDREAERYKEDESIMGTDFRMRKKDPEEGKLSQTSGRKQKGGGGYDDR